ncbi:ATP-binding cassette sub- D member 3 [Blomia tropicalis]|nr:ATP-binding cassette sub- D member 3 [Blomia tropicalis]
MTVLSKIFNEELDTSHHLTDKRNLFLGASMLSVMTWTTSMILFRDNGKNIKIDGISQTYLEKCRKEDFKQRQTLKMMLIQLKDILKQVLSFKDCCYATGIAIALILRTMCDLWMIQNLTQVEAAIIGADFKKLKLNILEFMLASPILALVNNGMKYCINRLQLSLRYKISSYLTEKYTDGLNYYRLNVMDNRVKNVDQLLTSDVDKFCSTLVDVYSNMAKPFLDIVVFIQRLSVTYTGLKTPGAMIAYLMFAGGILTSARRPLTRMTIRESQLEGELRFVHSRLIANCEEIAFYQGNSRENITMKSTLDRLREHIGHMLIFKFNIDYLDNMITRYMAQVCGYLALSMPFLGNRYAENNHTSRLETYYKSGRIMLKMSESIGRLVTAGRDLNRLAAYTQRINELFVYIDEPNIKQARSIEYNGGELQYCDPNHPLIELVNVPLVTPTGDKLVDKLNFKVLIGQNILITGPNGSGKSSLFRLLGELWPLYGGHLIKPHNDKLFYIPQKPYMALGSFRDQIIYPDTHDKMKNRGYTDLHLCEILNIVQLDYLLERETMDSVQDWQEVLSGGEKQRIALARLLYHRPQFAILDECTSAVSADVEQSIYRYLCDQKFCSLLSVTHRVKQLEKFHDYMLEFDGLGACNFKLIIEDL